MWIGAARGTLRASPHGKTSPARLHQSFASSRCFITMALGPPLAIQLPLSLLNWNGWRRCPIESWMKLYERRDGAPVNLASRSENPLNRNPSQKFAAEIDIETFLFPFFIMRIFHPGEYIADWLLGSFPCTLRYLRKGMINNRDYILQQYLGKKKIVCCNLFKNNFLLVTYNYSLH